MPGLEGPEGQRERRKKKKVEGNNKVKRRGGILGSVDSHFHSPDSNLHFPLHHPGRSGGPAAAPDPDPNTTKATNLTPKLAEEGFLVLEEEEKELEEEETLDPSKRSFSEALRECQNRRIRSKTLHLPGTEPRRQRAASVDLNGDAFVLSPRLVVSSGSLGAMKKSSAGSSRSRSGTFPSPGTPTYRQGGGGGGGGGASGYQKGWSSERVPLSANGGRRYVAGGALLPFNNGRTLPSKWEDAEKWIFSPVSGDGIGRNSVPPPHHRRPKSKSGPLGPSAYSAASPLVPCFDSGRVGGFGGGSPFLAGVLITDRGSCGSASSGRGDGSNGGVGGGRSSSANAEPYIIRSASVHGWSDTLIESSCSFPSSHGNGQDERVESAGEAATMTSVVLRRDVATQMSPDGSIQSSPKGRPSFSPSTPSAHPIEELESNLSKLEVRDVQVDDRVTVMRWSKKHIARGLDRRSTNIIEWRKKPVEAKAASGWEVTETAKCITKSNREEARITAWENLQKAKAEAAIRKLEMKLEKKRSSSMDKILNKLRLAQKRAQEMRTAVTTTNQAHQIARSANKRIFYFRKTGQTGSLSGCFCHAF